jgi:hypothetical protein
MGTSRMVLCANKQYFRAKVYADKKTDSGVSFPLVVTLYEQKLRIVNGVPFVPISKLDSFVTNFEEYRYKVCSFL